MAALGYTFYCFPGGGRKELTMSKLIPGNNKHLTINDRLYIESALDTGISFKDISRFLCKDPTTISKEVLRHRRVNTWNRGSFNNPHNFCIHRFRCKKTNACSKLIICDTMCRSCIKCNRVCPRFEPECCDRIDRAPYVCNGCSRPRHLCTIQTKYEYDAKAAQRLYEELRTSSREGLNVSGSRLRSIDKVVLPLITQGQSPYMIVTNHPELGLSVRTLYRYIDLGVLLSRNIDLKRKVKFKLRKSDVKKQIVNRAVFQGRTYDDFKALGLSIEEFVEMDTVLSARGSDKCILTIYFPDIELLVAHLMQRCTEGAVKLVFEQLQKSLGGSEEFIQYFPYLLTDRGSEFGDPESLEFDRNGNARTKIYYCDPMRSNQKAGIENVHTMLRMILPKGTVFTDLTQWDIRKAVDHINNAPRENLGGKTPYEKALWLYGKEFLKKLQLRYVAPDEVTLTPKLLTK